MNKNKKHYSERKSIRLNRVPKEFTAQKWLRTLTLGNGGDAGWGKQVHLMTCCGAEPARKRGPITPGFLHMSALNNDILKPLYVGVSFFFNKSLP